MVTLAVVVPIARYRHAHMSNHVLRPTRGRWTSRRTARGLRVVPLYPLVLGAADARSLVGVGTQRRDTHQADELQCPGGLRLGAQLIHQVRAPDVDSAAGDIAVETDLDDTPAAGRTGRPRPAPGRMPGRARRPAWRCRPSARRTPSSRSTVPCCAESGRPCASESAGRLCGIAFGRFRRRFLFARFAKSRAAQTRQNKDIGCWKEFRNRQQFNFGAHCVRRLPRPARAVRARGSARWPVRLPAWLPRRSFHPHQ